MESGTVSTHPRAIGDAQVFISDEETATGPFREGQVLADTFEVTGILGVGGMGVVYDAFDKLLLRRVAIKAPTLPNYAHALRVEAQGLAAIRSPGFVKVHGIGHHDGVEFLVMERLYGETLEARLDEVRGHGGHLEIPVVIDLLVSITDALSAAHRVGVAQRDLKPSNIMLCGDRVVLFDLGLFVPEVLVGPDNVASGSIDYISPEVLLRQVHKGDGPLVDLYALGVLAFELLTNQTPFADHSMSRTLMNHVSAAIPDVTTLRHDVPRDLGCLVTELLAKDPKLRPPSAEAVLWQLMEIKSSDRRPHLMRVLAVDDEPHVGRALKRSLESAFPRIHVEATTDPRRALSLTDAEPPDVILVDLNMPAHNGIEVCMNLLAVPAARRPMVVAMSADAHQSDLDVLHALGVHHFVRKDDRFVASMSNVIGGLRQGELRRERGSHTLVTSPRQST